MKSVLTYLYKGINYHSIFTSLIFISITVYILSEDMTTCLIFYLILHSRQMIGKGNDINTYSFKRKLFILFKNIGHA